VGNSESNRDAAKRQDETQPLHRAEPFLWQEPKSAKCHEKGRGVDEQGSAGRVRPLQADEDECELDGKEEASEKAPREGSISLRQCASTRDRAPAYDEGARAGGA
jgi:hypothetical protein